MKPLLPKVLFLALAFGVTGCASVVQTLANEPCVLHDQEPFTVVEVEPAHHEVRIYWQDGTGEPYLTLQTVRQLVEAGGDSLVAATNAGIYEPGYYPTGLLVIDGEELVPVNRERGTGNFFLHPNGIYVVTEDEQHRVIATEEWQGEVTARFATQSGPLLLRDGRIHPRFQPGSTNCRLRSGVGVKEDGSAVFAISNGALSFHDFAEFFRDQLGATDALYLDGGRSRMLYPSIGRVEDGQFAAIIAIVARGAE